MIYREYEDRGQLRLPSIKQRLPQLNAVVWSGVSARPNYTALACNISATLGRPLFSSLEYP